MSYGVIKDTRDLLINSSEVTALVQPANIRVGWSEVQVSMPAVIISEVTETDVGYLGFGTSSEGSRLHRIEATLQIDVLSQNSVKETLQIADAITKVLLLNSYAKITEVDMWDELLKAHRRMLRFRKIYVKEV